MARGTLKRGFKAYLYLAVLYALCFIISSGKVLVKRNECSGDKQCEDSDLYGNTCRTLGLYGGNLHCDSNCKFDTSKCMKSPPRCSSGPHPTFGTYDLIMDFAKHPCGLHPSGITWNPHTNRIFMVGDKGKYATMDENGENIECGRFDGEWWENDNEGVVISDHEKLHDRVFVAWENPKVGDNMNGYAVIKEYKVYGTWSEFKRHFVVKFRDGSVDNQGVEGIAFVTDLSDHENGGAFWIGDQHKGVAVKVRLPLLKDGDFSNVVFEPYRELNPHYGEVSGMHFDPEATVSGHKGGVLFVSSDNHNKMKAYTAQGEYLNYEKTFPSSSSNLGKRVFFPNSAIFLLALMLILIPKRYIDTLFILEKAILSLRAKTGKRIRRSCA